MTVFAKFVGNTYGNMHIAFMIDRELIENINMEITIRVIDSMAHNELMRFSMFCVHYVKYQK